MRLSKIPGSWKAFRFLDAKFLVSGILYASLATPDDYVGLATPDDYVGLATPDNYVGLIFVRLVI